MARYVIDAALLHLLDLDLDLDPGHQLGDRASRATRR